MQITDYKYIEQMDITLVFCQGEDIVPFHRVQIAEKAYAVINCSVSESFTGKTLVLFGIKGNHDIPRGEVIPLG